MKIAAKVMGGVLLAGAVLAAPATAQTSYTTQGFFSSASATCNTVPGFNPLVTTPLPADCSGLGFLLHYTPATAVNIGDGSITSLGQFTLTGTGQAVAPPGTVLFTIAIRQSSPTVGTGFTDGFISGSVRTAPPSSSNFSDLIWVPDQFVNINASIYRLIFDNVGPAADIGLGIPINNTRGIDAQITTTPEPASMALLATGLLGVVGVARRRRNSETA